MTESGTPKDGRPGRAGDGRRRVVVEGVSPEVDCGRFPAKTVVGDRVRVEADVFTDGHDAVTAVLRYRRSRDRSWSEAVMEPLVNDRFRGYFDAQELTTYQFTVEGWVDHFRTWRRDLEKRVAADQDVAVDLLVGAGLIQEAAERVKGQEARLLRGWADRLRDDEVGLDARVRDALSIELRDLMARNPDRRRATRYAPILQVVADRERARFSAWYEFFPRSCGRDGRHGTFADCERRLDEVARMGFDIVYLPPIHPIGRTHRKGRNNAVVAAADDVGSPWAIGAEEGGHKSVHPDLGTLEDFRAFRASAEGRGLEVALDVAFQVSPDHPYVAEHRTWFRARPDGTVQYAENPPKKYEDIYPFDFESADWPAMWEELKSIFDFWIGESVKIFRVDNPHTKAFPFWEWCIGKIRAEHPDVIFLSEAFTRPKVMYRLAKLGFTQSYTYFAWRNTRREIEEYFTELTKGPPRHFFRPNLWPNTPDILTEYLQTGGRGAFMVRLVLAATLGASYGIYGPAFELQEHIPRQEGSEEYLDSEKYQLRDWETDRYDSLADFIARVNRIRRQHAALHRDEDLEFHSTDNPSLVAYSKRDRVTGDAIVVVANLDPFHTHAGWVELPLDRFGLEAGVPYQVHDLLSNARFQWQGSANYVELSPGVVPAHIFHVERRTRTERDFEYYM